MYCRHLAYSVAAYVGQAGLGLIFANVASEWLYGIFCFTWCLYFELVHKSTYEWGEEDGPLRIGRNVAKWKVWAAGLRVGTCKGIEHQLLLEYGARV